MSFGSEGVDTLLPVWIAFNNLFTIYDEFQKLMEPSGYTNQDKNGRKIRVIFPMSNKATTFESLNEKFRKQKRQFLNLQHESMEENPNYKAKYFSKEYDQASSGFNPGFDFKRIMDYAEKHCWPNSQDDKTVKFIVD